MGPLLTEQIELRRRVMLTSVLDYLGAYYRRDVKVCMEAAEGVQNGCAQ
jgi:hypothetical protein